MIRSDMIGAPRVRQILVVDESMAHRNDLRRASDELTVQLGSGVQYSTGQYSTGQDSTGQDRTGQYSTVQQSKVQYSTVQYSTVR